jgi:hypothetical protein
MKHTADVTGGRPIAVFTAVYLRCIIAINPLVAFYDIHGGKREVLFFYFVPDTFLPPTLIPLSGVGTTCFLSCCDKDLAIIFTTGRLPDVNPP